ncbi:TPA: exodeoxyribonuclease VII large subunit [Candidatus Saccharibacteria bacterium]|nr:exodeoxyribonuclease VII large subunit [Candidatus Saccharibacteria bacterium]HRJ90895.1 exodeoxyribonuclease VII large subunit [Candidatus Saccharibacteria bacterium]
MEKETVRLSVSDFVALTNQTLEYAYPSVEVEGEVSSFKVNQQKFVFFDVKDDNSSVGCFMTIWQLRQPIEDGMRVIVTATPKLTNWGKFSLTVRAIRPSGEGSLKKSFELLKAKLEKEGLFALERKRTLPPLPKHIAVVSSTQAAGYADFIKILDDRFGGLHIEVAHVQVQGEVAADQMIRAIKYFNTQEELADVLVLIRGGGSADDLSSFNDELLVREVAASRIPVLTGIGHETDESLVDLAADVRGATPSNAAQILVPDKREIVQQVRHLVRGIIPTVEHAIELEQQQLRQVLEASMQVFHSRIELAENERNTLERVLAQLDPRAVLARGYSIVRGKIEVGQHIEIEQLTKHITAEVTNVKSINN